MAEANNKNQPMNQMVSIKYRLGQRPMAGLAFYDFDPEKFDLKSAFYWILEFMIQHKMQGHLMGSGHHQKRVLFRNGLKTLEKKGFENAGTISVDAVREGSGLDSWDHGYDFSFAVI
jgi:hypothetical protein